MPVCRHHHYIALLRKAPLRNSRTLSHTYFQDKIASDHDSAQDNQRFIIRKNSATFVLPTLATIKKCRRIGGLEEKAHLE